MKPFLAVFVLQLFTVSCFALNEDNPFLRGDPKYPKGNLLGLGFGHARYTTEWRADPDNDTVAVHIHQKEEAVIYIENRSIASFWAFHLDVRGEIRFSALGGTQQDYLEEASKNISDGGVSFAGGGHFKLALPFEFGPRASFTPFLGFGVTFFNLQSNAKGIAEEYERGKLVGLDYGDPWAEFGYYSPAHAGFNLDFNTFCITPEARYLMIGDVFTEWIGLDNPAKENLSFWEIMISLGFRLGVLDPFPIHLNKRASFWVKDKVLDILPAGANTQVGYHAYLSKISPTMP